MLPALSPAPPNAPDRSVPVGAAEAIVYGLFPTEALEKPGFSPSYAVEFWDQTNWQDWRAVESVQRGIGSRGYRPGTLTPREDAVYQFVTRIARAYVEGTIDPARRLVTAE